MRDEEIKREIEITLQYAPNTIYILFINYGIEYAKKLIEENPGLSEDELQEKVTKELQRIGDL